MSDSGSEYPRPVPSFPDSSVTFRFARAIFADDRVVDVYLPRYAKLEDTEHTEEDALDLRLGYLPTTDVKEMWIELPEALLHLMFTDDEWQLLGRIKIAEGVSQAEVYVLKPYAGMRRILSEMETGSVN